MKDADNYRPTIYKLPGVVLMDETTYDDLIMRVLAAENDAELMRERAHQLGLSSVLTPPSHP